MPIESTPTSVKPNTLKYVLLSAVMIIIGVSIVTASHIATRTSPNSATVAAPSLSDAVRAGTAPRAPLTASSTIKALEKTNGFQALVSYTDRGFEPKVSTIKKGDTIRFTNNSSHDLLMSVVNSELPSPTEVKIASQDTWEFTFSSQGEWRFQNTVTPSRIAVVRVQ